MDQKLKARMSASVQRLLVHFRSYLKPGVPPDLRSFPAPRSLDASQDLNLVLALLDRSESRFEASTNRLTRFLLSNPGDPDINRLTAETYLYMREYGNYATSMARTAAIDPAVQRKPDDPSFDPNYLEGNRLFRGPGYLRVLKWIHKHLKPENYLEIGSFKGDSLVLAGNATKAIGIDPEPRIEHQLPPSTTVMKMTSDLFFSDEVHARFPDGPGIDLAFIDGLHTFDQTLRDFINVEKFCRKGALVILHDVCPLNADVASREQVKGMWTGDVWKIVAILRDNRPDLELGFVPTFPSGLLFIRNVGDPDSGLENCFDDLVAKAMPLSWSDSDMDMIWSLPKIANRETAIRDYLLDFSE